MCPWDGLWAYITMIFLLSQLKGTNKHYFIRNRCIYIHIRYTHEYACTCRVVQQCRANGFIHECDSKKLPRIILAVHVHNHGVAIYTCDDNLKLDITRTAEYRATYTSKPAVVQMTKIIFAIGNLQHSFTHGSLRSPSLVLECERTIKRILDACLQVPCQKFYNFGTVHGIRRKLVFNDSQSNVSLHNGTTRILWVNVYCQYTHVQYCIGERKCQIRK